MLPGPPIYVLRFLAPSANIKLTKHKIKRVLKNRLVHKAMRRKKSKIKKAKGC